MEFEAFARFGERCKMLFPSRETACFGGFARVPGPRSGGGISYISDRFSSVISKDRRKKRKSGKYKE